MQPDSLTTAQAVANANALLAAFFPDLAANVIAMLAPLVVKGGPVVIALLTFEAGIALIRSRSEAFHNWTEPFFAKWGGLLNIVLSFLLSGGFKSGPIGASAGLILTALKAVPPDVLKLITTSARSTTLTQAGIDKSKTVALLVALGLSASLLAPHPASASARDYAGAEFGAPALMASTGVSGALAPAVKWYQRPVFALGLGERSCLTASPKGVPFLGLNAGWRWNDHLSPRVEIDALLEHGGPVTWEQRASLWYIF